MSLIFKCSSNTPYVLETQAFAVHTEVMGSRIDNKSLPHRVGLVVIQTLAEARQLQNQEGPRNTPIPVSCVTFPASTCPGIASSPIGTIFRVVQRDWEEAALASLSTCPIPEEAKHIAVAVCPDRAKYLIEFYTLT